MSTIARHPMHPEPVSDWMHNWTIRGYHVMARELESGDWAIEAHETLHTNANVRRMPRRHRQYIGVTPGGGDAA